MVKVHYMVIITDKSRKLSAVFASHSMNRNRNVSKWTNHNYPF